MSRINSFSNTLSSTCIMPTISVFYTGWLEITFLNVAIVAAIFIFILISPTFCIKYLVDDELRTEIDSIENVNHIFLPVYLGYIFVTFSIMDFYWFLFIYLIIVILLSFSKLMYFNLFFLCLGYSFYKIHSKNGISCYIVSKKFILNDATSFSQLKRLNNITFLEWSK